jgi:ribonuclease J
MQIIIYRGAKEIGGSAVEVRTDSGRILLDLGTPLDYDMREQENRGGAELVASGILPGIRGLYAWDEPKFDAILLSHAHLDHWGFIHFAHPDIPVYLSRGSEILLGVSVQFLHAKPPTGETRVFKMYEPFIVADMRITPYLVDHSAYDAAAFEVAEISSSGKRVVYTGDFRGHGRKKICAAAILRRRETHTERATLRGNGSR